MRALLDVNVLIALLDAGHVHHRREITNVYLLALAVHNRGRLVTFDRGIGIEAVKNAGNDNLLIMA